MDFWRNGKTLSWAEAEFALAKRPSRAAFYRWTTAKAAMDGDMKAMAEYMKCGKAAQERIIQKERLDIEQKKLRIDKGKRQSQTENKRRLNAV